MPFYRNFPVRQFRHFRNLREDIDRLYDEIFNEPVEDVETLSKIRPRVNIEETQDAYVLTAELPGMKKADVKITFQDNQLTISGVKKEDPDVNNRTFHRYERQFGSFSRTFNIPNPIQTGKISAVMEDGVLEVKLPKAEEAKPREINIEVK